VTEEIFDVVNELDEVIGHQTRPEVHRLGLRHRAVHVLVFNQRGDLFLQKRSMTKDRHPGTWDSSASGHLDHGESYDACAVRELREEIGLALALPPARLFKLEACEETGQEFVWVYRCQAEGPFVLCPEEISKGGWFAPNQVIRWLKDRPEDFAPTLPVIWQRLIRPPPRR
jgi:isopentenyldiphosphate isomerase